MDSIRFFNIEYFFYRIYEFTQDIWVQLINIDLRGGAGLLAGILGILFIGFLIVMIYTRVRINEIEAEATDKFKSHFTPMKKPEERANARWQNIERMFDSANPNDWRVAIIEADSMLEEFIRSLGYPGSNMGEQMKNIKPGEFPTLQNAWEAHKVRNRIAHEGMNYQLSQREVTITRRHYETVFHDARLI